MRQRLTRAWFGEGAAAWPAARLGRWPLPSGGPEAIECAAAARSSCQEAAVRVFGPVPRRHDGHAAGRGRGSAVLWWGSSCLEAAVSPGPSVLVRSFCVASGRVLREYTCRIDAEMEQTTSV